MAAHSSYLQTLEKNEAIALVSSLQKVKDHLSHELHWMNTQVQQKTTQLNGIETLLSEAVDMGLLSAEAVATPASSSSSVPEAMPDVEAPIASLLAELPATDSQNGAAPAAETLNSSASKTDSSSSGTTERKPRNSSTKNKRNAKAPATKTKTSNTKQAAPTTKPKGRASKSTVQDSKPSDAGDLRQFLQPEFRNKPMADSIAQVLDDSREPMSINDVMTELYDDLSGEEYKRAKTALTNLLSVGRSKGRWNSSGRGRYISKRA